jgi:hypothetical protein
VARLIFRYQGYLFFPMLLLEAAALHVASVRALTSRAARRRRAERALITIHAVGYLTVVFALLSPVRAVVFILVQQGLFGLYLGCCFAPTTRACPSWTPPISAISCAARRSLPATCAGAG